MDSDSQSILLLARTEAGLTNLDHTVQNFEQAAEHAERCATEMEEALAGEDTARDESCLQPLASALQASHEAANLALAAEKALNDVLAQTEAALHSNQLVDDDAPFPPGTLICDGRYRLLQLLHKRPRVNLYLARRVADDAPGASGPQPLVAIREIILAGLKSTTRQSVVRAAFEEFAAPQFFGSPHLPGVGDHIYLEDGRHYLIMQPRPTRGQTPTFAVPLSEHLPGSQNGSIGLPDLATALPLGTRLCQTLARLHHLHIYLGELTPAMVLVDRENTANWAPLLLASWPPAPRFWPGAGDQEALKSSAEIFPPLARCATDAENDLSAFVAPEVSTGRCDARSDVYALGALLYLLFTGKAPATAFQRLREEKAGKSARNEHPTGHASRNSRRSHAAETSTQQESALTSPHLLNEHISPLLEQILLRALSLDPEQRFASADDLAEALEGMHFKTDMPVTAPAQAKVSRLRRLLEWLKK